MGDLPRIPEGRVPPLFLAAAGRLSWFPAGWRWREDWWNSRAGTFVALLCCSVLLLINFLSTFVSSLLILGAGMFVTSSVSCLNARKWIRFHILSRFQACQSCTLNQPVTHSYLDFTSRPPTWTVLWMKRFTLLAVQVNMREQVCRGSIRAVSRWAAGEHSQLIWELWWSPSPLCGVDAASLCSKLDQCVGIITLPDLKSFSALLKQRSHLSRCAPPLTQGRSAVIGCRVLQRTKGFVDNGRMAPRVDI